MLAYSESKCNLNVIIYAFESDEINLSLMEGWLKNYTL